jgi:hypothetical protein
MAALKLEPEWRSIRTERRLAIPLADAALVLAGSDDWLPAAVGLDAVFGSVNRQVDISLGPVSRSEGCVRRHLAWRAAAHARLFPVMEGSITAIRSGPGECVLEVVAHYQPPLGRVGQLADRALLRLAAAASIERFSDDVSERLLRSAGQPHA